MKEEDQPFMTVSIKADKETKMGLITDVKQALREAYALKISYSGPVCLLTTVWIKKKKKEGLPPFFYFSSSPFRALSLKGDDTHPIINRHIAIYSNSYYFLLFALGRKGFYHSRKRF